MGQVKPRSMPEHFLKSNSVFLSSSSYSIPRVNVARASLAKQRVAHGGLVEAFTMMLMATFLAAKSLEMTVG